MMTKSEDDQAAVVVAAHQPASPVRTHEPAGVAPRAAKIGRLPPDPRVKGAMPYLATLVPGGMHKPKRLDGPAGMPMVIMVGGKVLGVVVAAGPEYFGSQLDETLTGLGYVGPFDQVSIPKVDAAAKTAAALAIAAQPDKDLDVRRALSSFGWNQTMLIGLT